MKRSIACIISPNAKRDKDGLTFVARQFSYAIEMLEDGVLFDVSGLGRLIGPPNKIAGKILEELQDQGLAGSVAVAETVETAATTPATLYAELAARHGFRLPASQLRVAVNAAFSDWDRPLRDGDEVVFIPPVAGG